MITVINLNKLMNTVHSNEHNNNTANTYTITVFQIPVSYCEIHTF